MTKRSSNTDGTVTMDDYVLDETFASQTFLLMDPILL
jgi:hypothetical protein